MLDRYRYYSLVHPEHALDSVSAASNSTTSATEGLLVDNPSIEDTEDSDDELDEEGDDENAFESGDNTEIDWPNITVVESMARGRVKVCMAPVSILPALVIPGSLQTYSTK